MNPTVTIEGNEIVIRIRLEHPAPVQAPESAPGSGEPLLYGVPDVKRILGIGHQQVYNLINSGELKSFKIGASRRVPREALQAYIATALRDGSRDDRADT